MHSQYLQQVYIFHVLLHFTFQHGLKDKTEDLLQGILHVLGILKA